MSARILFLVNGLGLGNSTRCHAIIERLIEKGAEVAVATSGNGLWYFRRKQAKKKVFRDIENQLIATYGRRVKKLTKTQGRILIRLVDRETEHTSYKIIKNFRGFLAAGFWQITARLFGHNLKSSYDPEKGEDKMIEHIIDTIIKS